MENWKEISETNGKYSVSNTGLVRRNQRILFDRWGRKRLVKERIISPCLIGKGYFSVTLRIDNVNCRRYVHRLVAIEFVEMVAGLKEVNHKDLNKKNNFSSNLEWVDRRGNTNHWMQQKLPGVSKVKKNGKWSSRIMVNGIREFLGYFETESEAKQSYEKRRSLI